MIVRRMEKLATSGLLSQSERGYTITEKGRRLVQLLGRLGTFFGHVNASAWSSSQPRRTT
jgi:predicted transcriptional regulator